MTTRTATTTARNVQLVQPQHTTRCHMSDGELRYRELEAKRAIRAQQRREAEQQRNRLIVAALAAALALIAISGWLAEQFLWAMAMAFSAC